MKPSVSFCFKMCVSIGHTALVSAATRGPLLVHFWRRAVMAKLHFVELITCRAIVWYECRD